jgi:hypothetical protein
MEYVASTRGGWKVVFKKRAKLLKAAKPFIGIEHWLYTILGNPLLGAITLIPVLGMRQLYEVLIVEHVVYKQGFDIDRGI